MPPSSPDRAERAAGRRERVAAHTGGVRSGGARRRPGTAYAAALAALVALVLGGCSQPAPAPSSSGSTAPSGSATAPTGSPTPPQRTTTPSPSPSLTGFAYREVTGGTAWPGPAQARLVRVAAGRHEGYDRLVLEFADGPVPEFSVAPQLHASFPEDPSDLPIDLAGDTGIRVVVRGTTVAATAADHLAPAYPAVREVERVGDFEAVVSYGVGVAGVARVRVTTLDAPARLVIDVLWP